MVQRLTEKTQRMRVGSRSFDVVSDDAYLDGMGGVYEPDTVSLIGTLVRPSDVALDIGANIGMTGLLLSQLARKVICFEPSPTTCGFLRRNVAGQQNVEVVNAGLGRDAADLKLVYSPTNRSGGFVSDRPLTDHAFESIRIENGDSFLSGMPVDFIKIDVEGFELLVLDGLKQTLARCKPVVTLEMNHWCLNAFQRTSIPDFLDALRATFPVLYAVHGGEALDLHDPAMVYHVMYSHILRFEYTAIVGAYREDQLQEFLTRYVWKTPRYLRMEARCGELERQAQAHSEQRADLERRLADAQGQAVRALQPQPWPVAARSLAVRAGRKLVRTLSATSRAA